MPAIHEEISAYLRSLIVNLSPGAPLPTEAEITRQFRCSRWSARKALDTLKKEGLVYSGQGRRTRVLDTVPHESFESVISAGAAFRRLGIKLEQETIFAGPIPSNAELSAKLTIPEGESIIKISRLRSAHRRPIIVEHLHFPWHIGRPLLDTALKTAEIHARLLTDGVDYQTVHRELGATSCPSDEAALLKISPNAPIFEVKVHALDRRHHAVEYSIYHYCASKVSIALETLRHSPSPLKMQFHPH
ncbi:UTRA domain-containing protein [Corynebacterium sp. 3HC-13]|uniref:GntR family transcriptional regulator n=1 Tax=Corynebacterium poyangense TaxID=2684405 RepID=UPI001CD02483|nr:GntR family transcriptional regulator [Corynebacterium poyangense]MBZ8178403.1 UTRA domain-containing protein [Corynebacterium poyangense]